MSRFVSHRVAQFLKVFIVAMFVSSPVAAAEAEGKREFRAGAATSNITPMLGGLIVGGWGTPKAERIHDELHARCLVLDDGKTRVAFVVCDSVGVAQEVFDAARKLIFEASGLPPQNILMSATHTHSATSARGANSLIKTEPLSEYQVFLSRRIADGVQRAINNLEPAKIGWGSADEPRAVFNRRYRMKPGTELLNPVGGTDQVKVNPGQGNPAVVEPAGPVDPQVSFITVQAADGRPIALLANYSLHYVGGVRGNEISADYFAVFADKIQQKLKADRLDPPFVGIMSNGTSGDVNNINVMGPKAEKKKPYQQIDAVAEMVAEAVFKAHQSVTLRDWVPLQSVQRELTLKTRKPTAEQIARAKQLISGEAKPKVSHEEIYAKRIMQLAESPDEASVVLQTMQIGDLGIAGIPFEVFTQSGLDIKARSPFKPTFTISIANGSFGYLPTPEAHKVGGYETWLGSSRVEEQASVKIVDTLMEMFDAMKKQASQASAQ